MDRSVLEEPLKEAREGYIKYLDVTYDIILISIINRRSENP